MEKLVRNPLFLQALPPFDARYLSYWLSIPCALLLDRCMQQERKNHRNSAEKNRVKEWWRKKMLHQKQKRKKHLCQRANERLRLLSSNSALPPSLKRMLWIVPATSCTFAWRCRPLGRWICECRKTYFVLDGIRRQELIPQVSPWPLRILQYPALFCQCRMVLSFLNRNLSSFRVLLLVDGLVGAVYVKLF